MTFSCLSAATSAGMVPRIAVRTACCRFIAIIQVRVLNIFRYAAPKVGKGPERRAEIAKSRANIPAAKWGIRARTFG